MASSSTPPRRLPPLFPDVFAAYRDLRWDEIVATEARFLEVYGAFLKQYNIDVRLVLQRKTLLGGREINPRDLFACVCECGGLEQVGIQNLFPKVISDLRISESVTSKTYTLRRFYLRYLMSFEERVLRHEDIAPFELLYESPPPEGYYPDRLPESSYNEWSYIFGKPRKKLSVPNASRQPSMLPPPPTSTLSSSSTLDSSDSHSQPGISPRQSGTSNPLYPTSPAPTDLAGKMSVLLDGSQCVEQLVSSELSHRDPSVDSWEHCVRYQGLRILNTLNTVLSSVQDYRVNPIPTVRRGRPPGRKHHSQKLDIPLLQRAWCSLNSPEASDWMWGLFALQYILSSSELSRIELSESEVAEAMPVLIDLLAEHFQRLSDCFFQSMESGTKYKGTSVSSNLFSTMKSVDVSYFETPLSVSEYEYCRTIVALSIDILERLSSCAEICPVLVENYSHRLWSLFVKILHAWIRSPELIISSRDIKSILQILCSSVESFENSSLKKEGTQLLSLDERTTFCLARAIQFVCCSAPSSHIRACSYWCLCVLLGSSPISKLSKTSQAVVVYESIEDADGGCFGEFFERLWMLMTDVSERFFDKIQLSLWSSRDVFLDFSASFRIASDSSIPLVTVEEESEAFYAVEEATCLLKFLISFMRMRSNALSTMQSPRKRSHSALHRRLRNDNSTFSKGSLFLSDNLMYLSTGHATSRAVDFSCVLLSLKMCLEIITRPPIIERLPLPLMLHSASERIQSYSTSLQFQADSRKRNLRSVSSAITEECSSKDTLANASSLSDVNRGLLHRVAWDLYHTTIDFCYSLVRDRRCRATLLEHRLPLLCSLALLESQVNASSASSKSVGVGGHSAQTSSGKESYISSLQRSSIVSLRRLCQSLNE